MEDDRPHAADPYRQLRRVGFDAVIVRRERDATRTQLRLLSSVNYRLSPFHPWRTEVLVLANGFPMPPSYHVLSDIVRTRGFFNLLSEALSI